MPARLPLGEYERIVFFTGAGMSAESGVPTYRGKGGIWKEYDYESCACQAAFERDPEHVWEFHNYRRELVAACEPNPGHQRIAQAQATLPAVTVITQNIDGLHQAAGSRSVLELHGSLWETRCDTCGTHQSHPRSRLNDTKCTCGRHLRPNIVWFGDLLMIDVLSQATAAITRCDLLVSIGTSANVYPAAELPRRAGENGAHLIEINPESTPLSHIYTECIRAPASEALAALCADL